MFSQFKYNGNSDTSAIFGKTNISCIFFKTIEDADMFITLPYKHRIFDKNELIVVVENIDYTAIEYFQKVKASWYSKCHAIKFIHLNHLKQKDIFDKLELSVIYSKDYNVIQTNYSLVDVLHELNSIDTFI
jgi:hypothetical protein